MKKNILLQLLIIVLIITSFLFFSQRRIPHPILPEGANSTTTTKDANSASADTAWQRGLTGSQIREEITRRINEQGGRSNAWINDLKLHEKESLSIKNVKKTDLVVQLLDRIKPKLYEADTLGIGDGVVVNDLNQAKMACALFTSKHSVPTASKAVLHDGVAYFAPAPTESLMKSKLHPNGGVVQVPTDFSRGWAVKLHEKDVVKIYRWNSEDFPEKNEKWGVYTESE